MNIIFFVLIIKDNKQSFFELSYKAITQKCDQKYFELVFYLRENKVVKFKFEFKNFILMHKKYFGEYWTTAIKFSAQLLFTVAVDQYLIDIREFILIELKDGTLLTVPNILVEYTAMENKLNQYPRIEKGGFAFISS